MIYCLWWGEVELLQDLDQDQDPKGLMLKMDGLMSRVAAGGALDISSSDWTVLIRATLPNSHDVECVILSVNLKLGAASHGYVIRPSSSQCTAGLKVEAPRPLQSQTHNYLSTGHPQWIFLKYFPLALSKDIILMRIQIRRKFKIL